MPTGGPTVEFGPARPALLTGSGKPEMLVGGARVTLTDGTVIATPSRTGLGVSVSLLDRPGAACTTGAELDGAARVVEASVASTGSEAVAAGALDTAGTGAVSDTDDSRSGAGVLGSSGPRLAPSLMGTKAGSVGGCLAGGLGGTSELSLLYCQTCRQ